jgi:hypothetical protein
MSNKYYQTRPVPCIHIFNGVNVFVTVCCATLGFHFALLLIESFKVVVSYLMGDGS